MSYSENSRYQVHYSLWLSKEMKEEMEKVANQINCSQSDIVRNGIQIFLDAYKEGNLVIKRESELN